MICIKCKRFYNWIRSLLTLYIICRSISCYRTNINRSLLDEFFQAKYLVFFYSLLDEFFQAKDFFFFFFKFFVGLSFQDNFLFNSFFLLSYLFFIIIFLSFPLNFLFIFVNPNLQIYVFFRIQEFGSILRHFLASELGDLGKPFQEDPWRLKDPMNIFKRDPCKLKKQVVIPGHTKVW